MHRWFSICSSMGYIESSKNNEFDKIFVFALYMAPVILVIASFSLHICGRFPLSIVILSTDLRNRWYGNIKIRFLFYLLQHFRVHWMSLFLLQFATAIVRIYINFNVKFKSVEIYWILQVWQQNNSFIRLIVNLTISKSRTIEFWEWYLCG